MAHRNITVTNNNFSFNPQILNQLVLWLDPMNPACWPGTGLSVDKASKEYFDLTTNHNDGVLSGGTTYEYPNINHDGTAYSAVKLPNIVLGAGGGSNNFTICAWIYVKDNTDSCYIISKEIDDYAIVCGFQSGYVNFIGNGSYQPTATATRIPVNNNEWTFITYTYSQYLGPGWYGFKNAVQQFNLVRTLSLPDDRLYLYIANSRPGLSNAFNGKTGPIFIYKRYLYPEEITYLYNATKSRYGL